MAFPHSVSRYIFFLPISFSHLQRQNIPDLVISVFLPVGVCVGLTNGKDNSRTRVLHCFWAKTARGEGRRIGFGFSWGQTGLNLSPVHDRAAASVGYTEFPLAFQKDRLSPVPPVPCLSSEQSCLSSQRTDQAPVAYKSHLSLQCWDVPERLSSSMSGK